MAKADKLLLARRKAKPPKHQFIHSYLPWGTTQAAAGINVTPYTAENWSGLYCAVKVISESVAQLPLRQHRRLGENQGKELLENTPAAKVLHVQPNSEQTPFMFKEFLTGSMCLWGNGYAEIQRDAAGRVQALWPMPPDKVKVLRDERTRELFYEYRNGSDDAVQFMPEEVFHVALSGDGICGKSPVTCARETIGLGMAAEYFGSTWFGNGSRPSGILTTDQQLSDQARGHLKRDVEQRHRGLTQANRIAILEEGLKWQQISVPPEDAQFLETRQFQVTEIARWFRIPPHLLMDLSHATFSNIEHQGIDFVVHTLMPWLIRWEEECNRKLGQAGAATYFKFTVQSFMRGDQATRYQAYATGRQWGFLSINDIRELEDLDPIGPEGDVYLSPSNMVNAEKLLKVEEPEPAPVPAQLIPPQPAEAGDESEEEEPEEDKVEKQRTIFRRLMRDAAGRAVHKEVSSLRRLASRHSTDAEKLDAGVRKFYREHEATLETTLGPTLLAWVDLTGLELDAKREASRWTSDSRELILNEIRKNGSNRLTLMLDVWAEHRADRITETYFGSPSNATHETT